MKIPLNSILLSETLSSFRGEFSLKGTCHESEKTCQSRAFCRSSNHLWLCGITDSLFAGIPGMKLGLANLAVLFILEKYTWKEAALVSVIRIFIIGFMFGNLFSILYSLAGAALSLTVMTVMKKKSDFSILGISVAGGVSHNIGQLLIACLITMTSGLIYYAPALLISGVITGLLIGTLTNEVLKRIHF